MTILKVGIILAQRLSQKNKDIVRIKLTSSRLITKAIQLCLTKLAFQDLVLISLKVMSCSTSRTKWASTKYRRRLKTKSKQLRSPAGFRFLIRSVLPKQSVKRMNANRELRDWLYSLRKRMCSARMMRIYLTLVLPTKTFRTTLKRLILIYR